MNCSLPTVQKHLDDFVLQEFSVQPKPIILVIDALYFGAKKDKDGLLVGKDWITGNIVYRSFIQSESKSVFIILAIVVDGRPGIRTVFADLPLQMCQFHLIQIVNRYITKKPKLIKRERSAVRSIQNNLNYLFTCKHAENKDLDIPNTTNCLDGWFSHLRKLFGCHNGLRKDRRNRVIEYILATHNDTKS